MKRRFGRFTGLGLAMIAALALTRTLSPAAERPNIIFILADDIGYGDLGCYGAVRVRTPNLDRLAREGVRFTDAHTTASTCTPSRRSLLTGAYSWRQQPGSAVLPGDAPLTIPPGTLTLPALLKQAGYQCGVVGKWHLGLGGEGGPDWNGEIKPGPLEIGFDYAFIMPATGDRVPCVYVENHRVVGLDPNDPIRVSYKEKIGDEPTGRENPELLKLRPTFGHDMTIVNGISRIGWMSGGRAARWVDEDMADTFARKAVAFIERNRNQPFFLYLAPHDIHVPRVPHPRFRGTSSAGARGDAIHQLDDTVGQVLAALERLKLAKNTLVIFSSDNGGVNDDGYEDFDPSDHKMNGPLRGRKGQVFEGGHRVPFLARWPAKIKPGRGSDELISLADMMATFAALTGVRLPDDAAPDSFNILPALLGRKHGGPLRPHLVVHRRGTQSPFAIRQGPWKLVEPHADERAEMLFNLAEDLSESRNLAAAHPEKVRELKALFQTLRERGRSR
ncbi:MAG: arylsulfatase [Verrucomicrobiales bacterium]|nr:arylsulfatase [Verrucomicrobiales bacterium]